MSDREGINQRLNSPLLLACAVAAGVPLVYFKADSAYFPKIALLAVTLLGAAVALLAAGLMFITRSLQERITRLEDRDKDSSRGGAA